MICNKCDKDLAECICPDLEERFNNILKSKFLFVGEEYQERIRAQIERNKQSHATSE